MTGQEKAGLDAVLAAIARTADCGILPPAGGSFQAAAGEVEPADLRKLRNSCGGLRLYAGSAYPWTVLPAPQPAGPILLGEPTADQVRAESPDDLTNSCYVIAADTPGRTTGFHIVIDLHSARSGRCYLTTWDTFGLVGDMPVVAATITDLLQWLLALGGGNPTEQLPEIGDAYDE